MTSVFAAGRHAECAAYAPRHRARLFGRREAFDFFQQLPTLQFWQLDVGSFKGESVGIGPALLWLPAFGQGKLNVVAKWLHDLEATNRLKADYGQLTIGYKF